jgi:hypothetical protein
MMRRLTWFGLLALGVLLVWGSDAQAQPSRQMPGSRHPIATSPPRTFPDPNTRTRPAASQIGFQSADVYAKPGYPKFLGDAVETGASQTGGAAIAGGGGAIAGGAGGIGGIAGGGTLGIAGGAGGGGTAGFLRPSRGDGFGGFTGGGFSGIVPKGFGFGGTPDLTHSSLNPLHGVR